MKNIYNRIADELKAKKTYSAWDRGVNAYALELAAALENRASYEDHDPSRDECREWMLNGARDWSEYSYGGCSLIYDGDIAERLCTPGELKRTRHGERRPNSREGWLDVQARAPSQACSRVIHAYELECRISTDRKE